VYKPGAKRVLPLSVNSARAKILPGRKNKSNSKIKISKDGK